ASTQRCHIGILAEAPRSSSPRAPVPRWSASPSRSTRYGLRQCGDQARGLGSVRRRSVRPPCAQLSCPGLTWGIQYAEAYRFCTAVSGILSSPAFAGDDSLWSGGVRTTRVRRSRLDLHIFKIAGPVVDADLRRRDPGRELTHVRDWLHQRGNIVAV